jgi:hypothetical protein
VQLGLRLQLRLEFQLGQRHHHQLLVCLELGQLPLELSELRMHALLSLPVQQQLALSG